jgi:hypothetical protein
VAKLKLEAFQLQVWGAFWLGEGGSASRARCALASARHVHISSKHKLEGATSHKTSPAVVQRRLSRVVHDGRAAHSGRRGGLNARSSRISDRSAMPPRAGGQAASNTLPPPQPWRPPEFAGPPRRAQAHARAAVTAAFGGPRAPSAWPSACSALASKKRAAGLRAGARGPPTRGGGECACVLRAPGRGSHHHNPPCTSYLTPTFLKVHRRR